VPSVGGDGGSTRALDASMGLTDAAPSSAAQTGGSGCDCQVSSSRHGTSYAGALWSMAWLLALGRRQRRRERRASRRAA
jgi:MYXO-CTERM domain-containing protein